MKEIISRHLSGHIETAQKLIGETRDIERAANAIMHAFEDGNKLLIAGNGGSVADSQHFAAELVGRFKKERKALPAIALMANPSAVTAISNDYSFEYVFARQVEAFGKAGDIFFGISTSGNSANIIKAAKAAKQIGLKTIGLTGKSGGKMKEHCDILINIPSEDTPRIQEVHTLIIHTLSDLIEEALYNGR